MLRIASPNLLALEKLLIKLEIKYVEYMLASGNCMDNGMADLVEVSTWLDVARKVREEKKWVQEAAYELEGGCYAVSCEKCGCSVGNHMSEYGHPECNSHDCKDFTLSEEFIAKGYIVEHD